MSVSVSVAEAVAVNVAVSVKTHDRSHYVIDEDTDRVTWHGKPE